MPHGYHISILLGTSKVVLLDVRQPHEVAEASVSEAEADGRPLVYVPVTLDDSSAGVLPERAARGRGEGGAGGAGVLAGDKRRRGGGREGSVSGAREGEGAQGHGCSVEWYDVTVLNEI